MQDVECKMENDKKAPEFYLEKLNYKKRTIAKHPLYNCSLLINLKLLNFY